jgi:hypothetical protein
MRKIVLGFMVVTALLLMATPFTVQAEEGSVKAMAPWQAEGKVYVVGPEKVLFLGEFSGIMYVETKEGSLDAALMSCPATQEIDVKAKTSRAHGSCIISPARGDLIFASWKCSGKPGGCNGEFKLTGGTGQFAGVSGSGDMLVRTAVMGLATDVKSGDVIRAAAGLAVWPKLTYKIP